MVMPFENNTNTVIRKLAVEKLRQEQTRRRITILSITLASALMAEAGIKGTSVVNEPYLALLKPSVPMILAMSGGLIVIMITGILVISNIFYIAALNDTKEYGQLRTIGMTAKQVKRLVLREGMYLSVKAVPAGILSGTILAGLLVPAGFRFENLLWAWPFVTGLSGITVFVSVRKPAGLAASVTPIEAVRQNCRDLKKNLLSVISLTLTGSLLFGTSSVLSSIDAREMSLQGFQRGQFYIRISDDELIQNSLEQVQQDNPLTQKVADELAQVPGVKEITEYHCLPVSNDGNASESDYAVTGFEKEDMELIRQCAVSLESEDYQTLTKRQGLIVGRCRDFVEYFGAEPYMGQVIPLLIFDGDKRIEAEFQVDGILDEDRIGNNGDRIDMLMLSTDTIRNLVESNTTDRYAIRVSEETEVQAEKEIEDILSRNPGLQMDTLSAAVAQNENFLQGMKWLLIAVIVCIGCFAVMNLTNTIFENIIMRAEEFALLRAVGMTLRQLNCMVMMESAAVSVYGLIFSLLLGGVVGAAVCEILRRGSMNYVRYHFPAAVEAVYCLVVLGCTAAVTFAALGRQNKLPLIEQLRAVEE